MEELEVFIFFREDGWYPIQLLPRQLNYNILLNPGTERVEDISGNVVWESAK